MSQRTLNLGCGTDTRAGWVNLDIAPLPGVDVVHDLRVLPLPFADESFGGILCNDILEHLDYPPLLKELHRILAPSGTLMVRVPHFTSKNNSIDPTHLRTFSVETFDFFANGTKLRDKIGHYMFDYSFRFIRHHHIDFERSSRLLAYNAIVERWVNASRRHQQIYEATGLSRLFPAQNISVTLIK